MIEWKAFRILDNARTWGMSAPDPIAVSEILNLADRMVGDPDDRWEFLRLVQYLDLTWREQWLKSRPKDEGKQDDGRDTESGV